MIKKAFELILSYIGGLLAVLLLGHIYHWYSWHKQAPTMGYTYQQDTIKH